MKTTLLSLAAALLAISTFGLAPAQAQDGFLGNGTCFISQVGNFPCEAWDATGMQNVPYGGVMEITNFNPQNPNIAPYRIISISDGTFIVEEDLGGNGFYQRVPATFFLDNADQDCLMADMDSAVCFRPF